MAENRSSIFKTAEQKHKENVILKCKICGEKIKGKSTLSRHISHAHNKIEPVKREKIVIDTYYGEDKVNKTIRKFKAGEYRNKAIPIDIGRYLRLAEIIPDYKKDQEIKDKSNEKTDDIKSDKSSNDTPYIKIDKLFVSVIDLASSKEKQEDKENKKTLYVYDLKYDKDKNEIIIDITKGRTISLSYQNILEFIEKNNAKNSILYICSNDKKYPVKSIEIKEDDEVAGDQIKCVVGYDSTESIEK